ncbi:hypothetical protein N9Y42_01580 [Mariniblastus sp.]|nr:hypothetical protein [Mariniblastus sp.]
MSLQLIAHIVKVSPDSVPLGDTLFNAIPLTSLCRLCVLRFRVNAVGELGLRRKSLSA